MQVACPFRSRLFWNNYLTNPATHYATGSLLNLDFAVSEHIGRWQGGLAGLHITQIADDTQFGVRLPPDGRRVEVFELGPVLAYDLPEYGASVKIKALKSLYSFNAVSAWGVAVGWIKKFD